MVICTGTDYKSAPAGDYKSAPAGEHYSASNSYGSTIYYISGCGGPYHIYSTTDYSHKTLTLFYKLVYFKKGDETWGKPFDTTNWILPYLIPDFKQVAISVYPNPSTGLVNIEIPEAEKLITGWKYSL